MGWQAAWDGKADGGNARDALEPEEGRGRTKEGGRNEEGGVVGAEGGGREGRSGLTQP